MPNEISSSVYTWKDVNGITCTKYTYGDGTVTWWAGPLRHRSDGPAIEYSNGDEEWWVNNILHRIDGPAIIQFNDTSFPLYEWWINGIALMLILKYGGK